MEHAEELNVVVPEYTNYCDDGKFNHDTMPGKDTCARKVVSNIEGGKPIYLVKQSGGQFYDPKNLSFTYRKQNWKFRQVAERPFNLYLQFLGHPNKQHLGRLSLKLRAEREQ